MFRFCVREKERKKMIKRERERERERERKKKEKKKVRERKGERVFDELCRFQFALYVTQYELQPNNLSSYLVIFLLFPSQPTLLIFTH